METALLWFAVFVVSLITLLKASDVFTATSESMGLILGVPQFVIGVTIVSIGTSLPELISSIIAVWEGVPEIVAGNVVGSNIANIFLILACGAVFSRKKLSVEKSLLPVELPLLIGSALFLTMTVYDDLLFSRGEAVLFVLAIILFVIFNIYEGRKGEIPVSAAGNLQPDDIPESSETRLPPDVTLQRRLLILLISGVFVYLGAKYTVESIIKLSAILQIPTQIIAVTAVALGTSLPELAVTYSAAKRGLGGIVIGNVLGSNLFNTFAVMGIPGLFAALPFPRDLIFPGLALMIVATVMFTVVVVDRKISRWEGIFFLILYVFFIGKSFGIV